MPEGLLETSLGWQEVVNAAQTPEDKAAAGAEACAALNRMDGFYGTRKLLVKSSLAIIAGDTTAESQAVTGIKYRDIVAKGWLGRIAYVRLLDYGAIAWPLGDATILKEPEIEIPEDLQPIAELFPQTDGTRRPIYMPVGFIDLALCAV